MDAIGNIVGRIHDRAVGRLVELYAVFTVVRCERVKAGTILERQWVEDPVDHVLFAVEIAFGRFACAAIGS